MDKIINLDLDFFVNPIAENRSDESTYLPDSEYQIWNKDQVRLFLELQCNLSKEKPTKGKIVTYHKEVFFLWKDLIKRGALAKPFSLWHVDAHDDLYNGIYCNGYPDVVKRFLFKNITERENDSFSNLDSGNYLLYALACRWISSLTLVRHPENTNYIPGVFFSKDIKSIEIKAIESKSFGYENKIIYKEPLINFRDQKKDSFIISDQIDWIFLSISPSFIPKKALSLIPIIKEYMNIV